ncbi:MAG: ADP-ribosylglycohydrolase family protein [Coriobacteriia bacterium]|nr:ADP-ribosylglycohydrolase family protein [Coriobacteriia bacterium]
MLGAIIGDTIGSVYEWNNIKTKEFPLFTQRSTFTDDSVMTVAVAHACLNAASAGGELSKPELVSLMQSYGRRYPDAGYGGRFHRWINSRHPKPYNSFGNGSAMRVSPVAWVADDLETVERLAAASAEVTHNHPEGIHGAQAVAGCILLARQGASNQAIRAYAEEVHGYDLAFTLDEIRPEYAFDVSCQGSVPQAIVALLESTSFEDAIRNAISIGGDSDTIAAIAGSIAQGRYGVPDELAEEVARRLPEHLRSTVTRFCERFVS